MSNNDPSLPQMPKARNVRVLGIIAARGGSKALPGKNLQPLLGKPLIAYTIDAANQAQLLDRTVVSTDASQIADVARLHGASTPFLRPPELAGDEISIYPTIIHALQWLEGEEGYPPDYAMLLQPTSPLRTAQDIDNSITIAVEKNAVGVVSLCEVNHHPYHMKQVSSEGRIADFLRPDKAYHRRQELPPAYAPNGAIYLASPNLLVEHQTFYADRTYAYIMPPERSLDIDTPWDIYLAELILSSRNGHD